MLEVYRQPFPFENFAMEITALFAALNIDQEPLGEEFEAIWDANTDRLYEV